MSYFIVRLWGAFLRLDYRDNYPLIITDPQPFSVNPAG